MTQSIDINAIEYRKNAKLSASDIAAVFISSGIRRPSNDLERITRMFANSNLIFSAWYHGRLIGVCRALTDFAYCCYLSDLAVNQQFQKLGVGQALIAKVSEAIGEEVALILLSSPEAMDYYPKLGFEKIENGYIIKRKV